MSLRNGHPALLLALTLAVAAAIALPALGVAAPAGGPIANGYYFTETGGYRVVDGSDGRFWSEFQRLGGVTTLGYPVSRVYEREGFRYQAFQRGVLQWRPEANQAWLSNTFDWLTAGQKDEWLGTLGIPGPLQDQSNGNYTAALAERAAWLTNAAIKTRYLTNPSTGATWSIEQAASLYGVPQSRPEQRGPFVVQRFQRIAFQLWTESVPSMPARGSVVGVLGGDLVKTADLMPATAKTTESEAGSPTTPAPTAAPTMAATPVRTATSAPTATATRSAAAPTAAPTIAVTPPSNAIADLASYAVARMNGFRTAGGLAPLTVHATLTSVAQKHATMQASARLCSHTGADGSSLEGRLKAAGFGSFVRRGENISCGAAYGNDARAEIDGALAAFMAEPAGQWNHRGNIMEPGHKRIGVGLAPAANNSNWYFVTNFLD